MNKKMILFFVACIVVLPVIVSCSDSVQAKHVHAYDGETNRCSCGEFNPDALLSIKEIADRRFKTLQKAATYIESLYSSKGVEDRKFTLEVLGNITDSGFSFSGDVKDLNISLTFPQTDSKLTIPEDGEGISIASGISLKVENANIVSKSETQPIIKSEGTVEISNGTIVSESTEKPVIESSGKATITGASISTTSSAAQTPTIVSSGEMKIENASVKTASTENNAPAIQVVSGKIDVTGSTKINEGDSSKQAISIAPEEDKAVEINFDKNFNGSVSGEISISEGEADKNTTLNIQGGTFDVKGLGEVAKLTTVSLGGQDTKLIIPEEEITNVSENSVSTAEHVHLFTRRHDEDNHWLYCSCGEEKEKENHADSTLYREKITKESTCTEKGEKELFCPVCDRLMDTTETDMKAHNLDYDNPDYSAPTCTKEGYNEYKCRECDYKKRDYLSPTDHNFVFSTQTDSTCTKLGVKVSICSCGLEKTEEIALKAHQFGEWQTSGSKVYRVCSVCQTEEVSGHTHSFTEKQIKTSATCLASAVYTYGCTCGYTEERTEGKPLGHKYILTHTDSEHWEECENCSHVINKSVHSATLVRTEATCTTTGTDCYICDKCRYVVSCTDIPMTSHTEYLSSRVDADCSKSGEESKGKKVYSCIKCKKELYTTTTDAQHVFRYFYDESSGTSYWECVNTKCKMKIYPAVVKVDDSALGIKLGEICRTEIYGK